MTAEPAPDPRRDRLRRRRRRHRGLVRLAVALVALCAIGGAWAWVMARGGGSHPAAAPATTAARADDVARTLRRAVRPALPPRLAEHPAGSLAAPLQDAAAATLTTDRMALLGGLDAADTSTADVRSVGPGGATTLGRLPGVLHDAAAAALGGRVYLFGGGDGVRQLDGIVRVAPDGRTSTVGHLPAPASDVAAAAVGSTAYVIGGYTGTRWLDTIVAWHPGSTAHVVAHLPGALRYAAAASVGGLVVIAGGSQPAGSASSAVLVFDPSAGTVRRIGSLPAATTHAAAATLGGAVYVVGGRGAAAGSVTARIVGVDPATRRIWVAGALRRARSDLSAVGLGSHILLAGGSGSGGTLASIGELRLRPPASSRTASATTARTATATRTSSVPPLIDPRNVYAADGAGMLSPVVRSAPRYVYVPNSVSNTVDVISQRTFRIVAHYAVGVLPQHVTPSYDLRTLYVDNDIGNSLTPVDPHTGRPKGAPIPVDDPYNLYFTPDGRYAIVVAERLHRLDFRNPRTFRLHHSLAVPCGGVDHLDFTADGRYLLASCEFSGQVLVVDARRQRVVRLVTLRWGAKPQDVKLAPDGRVFYVADLNSNGVWIIDAHRFRVLGFRHTGLGAHGLYPSRDAKLLYVSNRDEGSVSVISFRTRKVVAKWRIPGGGSPDMGGVSADGNVLWLSGRYSGVVYAISTHGGRLLARIPVGAGPHGLCVWPQPGRYSLGHTGILR